MRLGLRRMNGEHICRHGLEGGGGGGKTGTRARSAAKGDIGRPIF